MNFTTQLRHAIEKGSMNLSNFPRFKLLVCKLHIDDKKKIEVRSRGGLKVG
jgi:hypothetical protein